MTMMTKRNEISRNRGEPTQIGAPERQMVTSGRWNNERPLVSGSRNLPRAHLYLEEAAAAA